MGVGLVCFIFVGGLIFNEFNVSIVLLNKKIGLFG